VASRIGEAAQQAARRARLDMGFGLEGPLPDLLEAVEGPGGAQVVVLELGEDVAGACLQRGGLVLLFVNGAHAAVRRRFTLAHEFGHCRLSHASVIDRPADVAFGTRHHDPAEVAANYFAAEFLMPGQAVRRWARGRRLTLDEVVRLAAEYGVSAKMARIRLETAEALRDRTLMARLDAEIDEERLHLGLAGWFGWKDVRDTLADATPPRLPPVLRDSALGGVLAGDLTVAQAAARSRRSTEEMRRALADLGLDRLVPIG
jgi:Zn-dependent peptidase ImmA (M78 family)